MTTQNTMIILLVIAILLFVIGMILGYTTWFGDWKGEGKKPWWITTMWVVGLILAIGVVGYFIYSKYMTQFKKAIVM